MSQTGDDLALILDAARAAGAHALARRGDGVETRTKADGTPVTDVDMEVDAMLQERLTAARPHYGWLSEETADDPIRLSRARVFVIDPIDGTRAYIKGRPWWTVSIAVIEEGRPVAGVVCAPEVGEVYQATAGGGASCNGLPLSPSAADAVEGCRMLADAPQFRHPGWPVPWPPMAVENRNSIAYRLCQVGAGAFDATLTLSGKGEWDLAAADLIASEAGCLVTDHKGSGLRYNQVVPRLRSLVCAGPRLHGLLLERTQPIDLP